MASIRDAVGAPYNTASGRDCVKSLRLCLHGTCPQKNTKDLSRNYISVVRIPSQLLGARISGAGDHKADGVGVPLAGRDQEREFSIDNLLVRIHFIIVMIRWTGLDRPRAMGV